MAEPQHYRAKLQFQTRSFGGSVKAGLFSEGSHCLVAIDDCLVQDQLTQAIVNHVTQLLDRYRIPIYNERRVAGIRTVMVRRAQASDQVQLIFVSSKEVRLAGLIAELTAAFPQIRTVALNINTSKTSDIYGAQTEILWGQETIQEEVLSHNFALSPRAFISLIPHRQRFYIVKWFRRLSPQLRSILLMLLRCWLNWSGSCKQGKICSWYGYYSRGNC